MQYKLKLYEEVVMASYPKKIMKRRKKYSYLQEEPTPGTSRYIKYRQKETDEQNMAWLKSEEKRMKAERKLRKQKRKSNKSLQKGLVSRRSGYRQVELHVVDRSQGDYSDRVALISSDHLAESIESVSRNIRSPLTGCGSLRNVGSPLTGCGSITGLDIITRQFSSWNLREQTIDSRRPTEEVPTTDKAVNKQHQEPGNLFGEPEASSSRIKAKKRKLRKRIRRRLWKAARRGWKYIREGLLVYSAVTPNVTGNLSDLATKMASASQRH